jgi:hypothetical protein
VSAFSPQPWVDTLEDVCDFTLPAKTEVISETSQGLQFGREFGYNIVFDFSFHNTALSARG